MSSTDDVNQSIALHSCTSYDSTTPPGTMAPPEPTATYPPPTSSDPAYPPPLPQPTAPPTVGSEQSEKPSELPAYSEPPPSYQTTFPEAQQPAPPQNPAYPPTSYQYATPNPQTMVRTFGAVPVSIACPHCQQQVTSEIRFAPGLLTYIVMGTCLLFGGWFGCCLIPFCINDLKDVYHTCPNCKGLIGRYDRLS